MDWEIAIVRHRDVATAREAVRTVAAPREDMAVVFMRQLEVSGSEFALSRELLTQDFDSGNGRSGQYRPPKNFYNKLGKIVEQTERLRGQQLGFV